MVTDMFRVVSGICGLSYRGGSRNIRQDMQRWRKGLTSDLCEVQSLVHVWTGLKARPISSVKCACQAPELLRTTITVRRKQVRIPDMEPRQQLSSQHGKCSSSRSKHNSGDDGELLRSRSRGCPKDGIVDGRILQTCAWDSFVNDSRLYISSPPNQVSG